MNNTRLVCIDQPEALRRLCHQLHGCSWLAVDTEFERTKTYYPELCLLQLSNTRLTAIIDPQAITDLSPLYAVLYDPGITLVFHAARQDLEIFYHHHHAIPLPLFDTQIAAGLLGYEDQIGYARLVAEELQVQLAKSATRTDWKRRPLTDKQRHYAADDVGYLSQLYPILRKKLIAADLLAKHDARCHALTRPETYQPDPDSLWRKINAASQLPEAQRIVLQKLTSWRELTAQKKNLPRQWVLPNRVLVELARCLPDNSAELARTAGMNKKTIQRYGHVLLAIIQRWQENNSDMPA